MPTMLITDKKYNSGVVLDNYMGEYSLVSARKSEDGTIYRDFGTVTRGHREYKLPIAAKLGDKAQTIKILKKFLATLQEEEDLAF